MKFITTNDWHLASIRPASRIDNYIDELFGLLEQIRALALAQRADILHGGDFFHKISRIDWASTIRLYEWAEPIRAAGLRIIGVPGNHDLLYNRLDSLGRQPLGLLFKTGIFEDATHRWISSGDGSVLVYGVPFPDAFDPRKWPETSPEGPVVRIVLAHCFASPEGGDYFGEPIFAYERLASFPFEVYVFGHDHRNGGIWRHEPTGKWFVNLGGLCRGSIAVDDVTRPITVGLVDVAPDRSVSVREVLLNYRPASEIFDLSKKAQIDAERAQIDAFVETLGSKLDALAQAGPVEVDEAVGRLNLAPEIRTRLYDYLKKAEKAESA